MHECKNTEVEDFSRKREEREYYSYMFTCAFPYIKKEKKNSTDEFWKQIDL